MDGPTVEVFGNAQDGVGNTMNAGKVIVHGDAGDVLGYGMRGGKVFIKGDVGYRVGIHMKAYEDLRPIMVCGGKARDFFGEYMAGGLLILLGMNSRLDGPARRRLPRARACTAARSTCAARSSRGSAARRSASSRPTRTTSPSIGRSSRSTARRWAMDLDEVLSEPFTKLIPVSHRPYGKLYAYL